MVSHNEIMESLNGCEAVADDSESCDLHQNMRHFFDKVVVPSLNKIPGKFGYLTFPVSLVHQVSENKDTKKDCVDGGMDNSLNKAGNSQDKQDLESTTNPKNGENQEPLESNAGIACYGDIGLEIQDDFKARELLHHSADSSEDIEPLLLNEGSKKGNHNADTRRRKFSERSVSFHEIRQCCLESEGSCSADDVKVIERPSNLQMVNNMEIMNKEHDSTNSEQDQRIVQKTVRSTLQYGNRNDASEILPDLVKSTSSSCSDNLSPKSPAEDISERHLTSLENMKDESVSNGIETNEEEKADDLEKKGICFDVHNKQKQDSSGLLGNHTERSGSKLSTSGKERRRSYKSSGYFTDSKGSKGSKESKDEEGDDDDDDDNDVFLESSRKSMDIPRLGILMEGELDELGSENENYSNLQSKDLKFHARPFSADQMETERQSTYELPCLSIFDSDKSAKSLTVRSDSLITVKTEPPTVGEIKKPHEETSEANSTKYTAHVYEQLQPKSSHEQLDDCSSSKSPDQFNRVFLEKSSTQSNNPLHLYRNSVAAQSQLFLDDVAMQLLNHHRGNVPPTELEKYLDLTSNHNQSNENVVEWSVLADLLKHHQSSSTSSSSSCRTRSCGTSFGSVFTPGSTPVQPEEEQESLFEFEAIEEVTSSIEEREAATSGLSTSHTLSSTNSDPGQDRFICSPYHSPTDTWENRLLKAARCGRKGCEDKFCREGQESLDHFEQHLQSDAVRNCIQCEQIGICTQSHSRKCDELLCALKWCDFFHNGDDDLAVVMSLLMTSVQQPLLDFGGNGYGANIITFHPEVGSFDGLSVWTPIMRLGKYGKTVLATELKPDFKDYWCIKKLCPIDQDLIDTIHQLQSGNSEHVVDHLWLSINNDMNFMLLCTRFEMDLKPLTEFLKPTLNTVEVLHCLNLILAAVEYLHQQGILYLLWTSCNIIYDGQQKLKLSNFTAAVSLTSLSDKSDSWVQDVGMKIPVHVVPPELLDTDSFRLCFKTDSWGIACLTFELLTGVSIFDDLRHEDPENIRRQIKRGALPGYHDETFVCHDEKINRLLKSCFQMSPEKRPDACGIRRIIS